MTYTVNCSILFTELPLLERAAAAKAAGFDSVEFWWPFATAVPADSEVEAFIASIKDAGVRLDGLNFFAGDMTGGDRGLVSWVGRESEFLANIEVVTAIGEATGCKGFNALYGNRQSGIDGQAQDKLAISNLVAAAKGVECIGGTVLLEPISGSADYPLKTSADAFFVLEKVHAAGASNIKLLADFYHLAVNGEDVAALIEGHAHEFGHVQIADDPGRGAPGTGTLPLGEWVTRSREFGYSGGVALEYKAAQAQAFTWLIRQPA